jgi:biotin carboxylase
LDRHVATATRNKVALRRALRDHVAQPAYQVLEPGTDVGAIAADLGFPVVVKPLSRSASQGVIRADDQAGVRRAERRIRMMLARCGVNPNEPLLVERFVTGPEVAVEGILTDGDLQVLAVFDKPDPLDGPYFEETIYVSPSRLHPEVLTAVTELVAEATGALGLVTGPVHAEVRVSHGIPVLIELAARPIGGHCGRALRFGLLGTSLDHLLLRAAVGGRVDRPGAGAVGALMLPIPTSGRLMAVHGLDAARAIPHVDDIEVAVPIGERIDAVPDGDRYLGFAFASADDPATVEAALRTVMETVEVDIDPTGHRS